MTHRAAFTAFVVGASSIACIEPSPPQAAEPAAPVAEPAAPSTPERPPLPTPTEPEPKPEPKPEALTPLFAAIELHEAPADVAKQLARDWCEHGGETFNPIAQPKPDEFYPYTLESCDQIMIEEIDRKVSPELTGTLIRLDANYSESRVLLLLQGQDEQALVELDHDMDDASGEGPSGWNRYEGIELRDVSGDPTPEWIATYTTGSTGSFESDRCYNEADSSQTLIVCSQGELGFACFAKLYLSVTTSKPWSDLEECDMTRSELPRQPPRGKKLRATLRRDSLQLAGKTYAEDNYDSATIEAGRFALDTLFETDAIPIGVFPIKFED